MNILMIAYYFPPFNIIGAVRAGKTAKYFRKQGHEVRVISCADQPLLKTLPIEIPLECVTYTPWLNVNRPTELLRREGGKGSIPAAPVHRGRGYAWLKMGWEFYKNLLNFPDGQVGWLPFARRAGQRLIRQWRPDVIFASAVPFTALLAASNLSRKSGIPWVGELRDLWMDNHYWVRPAWRRVFEERLEMLVLSSASGLVTVSEPLAEVLRKKFARPTTVITNGFDPEDYPADGGSSPASGETLNIVYTGGVYEGRRDPSSLFRALKELGGESQNVRVHFYGGYLDAVRRLAARYEVSHLVEVHDPVSYKDSLTIQKGADILLLLFWNDPKEKGVFTGKLFEYLGARRPILLIGAAGGVAPDLVRDRKAGVVLNEPGEIARQLNDWIRQKASGEGVAALPAEAGSGFTREAQVTRLAAFLEDCVRRPRAVRRSPA